MLVAAVATAAAAGVLVLFCLTAATPSRPNRDGPFLF
jgi:hypothetical protein